MDGQTSPVEYRAQGTNIDCPKAHYWTFSKIETYKFFGNLLGLGAKQKCPVVWSQAPGFDKNRGRKARLVSRPKQKPKVYGMGDLHLILKHMHADIRKLTILWRKQVLLFSDIVAKCFCKSKNRGIFARHINR